jgi:hypothetical protein
VISRVDSRTTIAAKGSRNILNSAYLLDGIVNTFPFESFPSLICPPTTYTLCAQQEQVNINSEQFKLILFQNALNTARKQKNTK